MGTAVSSGPGMVHWDNVKLGRCGNSTHHKGMDKFILVTYPLLEVYLQTIFQLGTQIFEGHPINPLVHPQNATVGQQRAGLLNKFLQQLVHQQFTDPYSVGVTGRNGWFHWVQLKQVERH